MKPSSSIRPVVLAGWLLAWGGAAVAQETGGQPVTIESLRTVLKDAGESFRAGRYFSAGEQLEQAKRDFATLADTTDAKLLDALPSIYQSIDRAQRALALEGITLTPLAAFDRGGPASRSRSTDAMAPEKGDRPSAPAKDPRKPPKKRPRGRGKPPAEDSPSDTLKGVSFSRVVAPLLISHCGGCHVEESKGDFSAASYAALMRGVPNVGTVVFANDAKNSRLIEVIASGDMPRGGGGLPAADLDQLRRWIDEGAAFDGDDPEQPLRGVIAAAQRDTDSNESTGDAPETARMRADDLADEVVFAKDIAPLLLENCRGCHIAANQVRGQLRMDTVAQLLNGGVSGEVIASGKSRDSLLIKKLRGEVGQRMPVGRPPLSDEQIALIARWIDSGAAVTAAERTVPLERLATLAWVNSATPTELSERRRELAGERWRLVSPQKAATELSNEQFLVIGNTPPASVEAVLKAAQDASKQVQSTLRQLATRPNTLNQATTTIFVFDQRYDYAEFGQMIESRELPSQWRAHWRADGIDAYIALVTSVDEEDDELRQRLVHQLAALRVAQLGDSPHWFSEGLGRAIAARGSGRDGLAATWNAELPEVLRDFAKPEQLLDAQLPAARADLIGYVIGQFLLDKTQRRQLDGLLQGLADGANLSEACERKLGVKPAALIGSAVAWYRSQPAR